MDIEEIKKKIAEDKNRSSASYRRYPVRFVFMEMSNNTQNEIRDLIKNTEGELLDLSDFILKHDGWMTKSSFIHVIKEKSSKEKDTYVLGFSELIRFFSRKEIESTVLSLFDIENQNMSDGRCGKKRIYLICFSMADSVRNVLKTSFQRRDLLDPFINSDYEENGACREICFVSSKYSDSIKQNKIKSSNEWLGLWRHSETIDFALPIWCCSENLYNWHQKASPDNAFQIDVVRNTKDYLKKAYGLDIPFDYAEKDNVFWENLKNACLEKKVTSLAELFKSELGVNLSLSATIAGRYLTTDASYIRWLIEHYVVTYQSDSFLAMVFKNLKLGTNKEFISSVWKLGFLIDKAQLLKERFEIIKELNKYAETIIPEKEIQNFILEGIRKELRCDIQQNSSFASIVEQTGLDVSELRNCLLSYYLHNFKPAYTGLCATEKEFVINLCSLNILSADEIREIYPSLFFYLYGTGDNKIDGYEEYKQYLDAYRKSKISEQDTDYLKQYYSGGSASSANLYNMYYKYPHQEIVAASYADNSDIYILDGVGAEYLPLLVELIKNKGYTPNMVSYGVCHLPSITSVNKEYLSTLRIKDWIMAFDSEVIHGKDKQKGAGECYRTATNLRKAFDILEAIIKQIISESNGKRIVITADHGATARAKWTYPYKKYSFVNADHEGRCCRIDNKDKYEDTADYIVFEDEGKPGTPYLVALNEVSLNNKPRFENHGGATPEEMLVPIIVAEPTASVIKSSYKVLSQKLEVSGLDKEVSFVIIPNPSTDVYVKEANGERVPLKLDGDVYKTELFSGREQNITVVVDEKEYQFRTVSKSKKNMEEDDGFDD